MSQDDELTALLLQRDSRKKQEVREKDEDEDLRTRKMREDSRREEELTIPLLQLKQEVREKDEALRISEDSRMKEELKKQEVREKDEALRISEVHALHRDSGDSGKKQEVSKKDDDLRSLGPPSPASQEDETSPLLQRHSEDSGIRVVSASQEDETSLLQSHSEDSGIREVGDDSRDEEPSTPSTAIQIESPAEVSPPVGNVWVSTIRRITPTIGSGVLSISWSIAQVGWLGGPVLVVLFAVAALVQSFIFAACFSDPDIEHGRTGNRTYMDAVKEILGDASARCCGVWMRIYMYLTGIAYTITCIGSMGAIWRASYHHKEDHCASCTYDGNLYLLFGAIQIILYLIPNFHNQRWLPILDATLSLSYSLLGLGLGLLNVIVNRCIKGSTSGVPMPTMVQKLLRLFQAAGNILCSYTFSMILLDIQITLETSPSEKRTNRRAAIASFFINTLLYICCGFLGYAALGDEAPENLLADFGLRGPYGLLIVANICIATHMLEQYQVSSQPILSFMEGWVMERFPSGWFVPQYRVNVLKLFCRMIYLTSTIGLALFFPYLSKVLGILGALNFYPVGILYPVKMYIVHKKLEAWTPCWYLLQLFHLLGLLVTILVVLASSEGLLTQKLLSLYSCK